MLTSKRPMIAGVLLALSVTLVLGLARDRAGAATARASGKATTRIVTATSMLSQANQVQRLEAHCPKGKSPYGGGMTAVPVPSADGEGVYPHIWERIGFQQGFHVTPVLFDPAAPTTARTVTVQVVCGPNPGKVASPRTTVQVNPGQPQTTSVTCPAGRHLISGGFQQTDFTSKGGDFPTQSQAIGGTGWTATGSAFGTFGGQLSAVAYCVKGKGSFQEMSGSATIPPGATGTATTPPCPAGKRLVSDGFNTSPAGSTFFANGTINADQSFSASGYNRSTSPATITGYAYCLRIKPPKRRG